MMRSVKIGVGLVVIVASSVLLYFKWGLLASEVDVAINGPRSVSERVQQYGPAVSLRLKTDFEKAGVSYPPSAVTLVVLKQEKQVELYAEGKGADSYRYIRTYPIYAASGRLGPKLRQGDWQVPEGVYDVESLNPNSHYHLALHVDYPNAFDREKAQADGRVDLGGDIMIHGSNVSIGCVAMGDSAAEDFFVLAAQAGTANVHLLFCPFDFRVVRAKLDASQFPPWITELYADLTERLNKLPLPPGPAKIVP
jgi:murein L,D-transpeptidase YafK